MNEWLLLSSPEDPDFSVLEKQGQQNPRSNAFIFLHASTQTVSDFYCREDKCMLSGSIPYMLVLNKGAGFSSEIVVSTCFERYRVGS